jgi:hypothetical protein
VDGEPEDAPHVPREAEASGSHQGAGPARTSAVRLGPDGAVELVALGCGAVFSLVTLRIPPRRPAFIADLLLRTLASRRLDQVGR